MKKLLIVLSSFFVLALLLSSCKSHERCPAYGKVVQDVPTEKSC